MLKKIVLTFFVEGSRNPYENVNTFNIFRQQYRRKMLKLRKKVIFTLFAISTCLDVSEPILSPVTDNRPT